MTWSSRCQSDYPRCSPAGAGKLRTQLCSFQMDALRVTTELASNIYKMLDQSKISGACSEARASYPASYGCSYRPSEQARNTSTPTDPTLRRLKGIQLSAPPGRRLPPNGSDRTRSRVSSARSLVSSGMFARMLLRSRQSSSVR